MCYVHNQWYDISCAILYFVKPITAGLYRTKDLTVIISRPQIFHK